MAACVLAAGPDNLKGTRGSVKVGGYAQGHYEMTAPVPKSGQHRITLAEKTFMLRVKTLQTALLQ